MAWCNILLAVLALLPCVAVTTFVFQPHLLQLGSRHAISAEQLGRLTDAARLRQMLSEEVHFGGVMLTGRCAYAGFDRARPLLAGPSSPGQRRLSSQGVCAAEGTTGIDSQSAVAAAVRRWPFAGPATRLRARVRPKYDGSLFLVPKLALRRSLGTRLLRQFHCRSRLARNEFRSRRREAMAFCRTPVLRPEGAKLVPPFQGLPLEDLFPGRCPGLPCLAPSGLRISSRAQCPHLRHGHHFRLE